MGFGASAAGAYSSRDFKLELYCAALAHRRRMVAAAMVVMNSSGSGPQGPKPKPPWEGFSWANHVARLSESDFKLRYRLTADAFHYKLLPLLRSRLAATDELRARYAKHGQLVEPALGRTQPHSAALGRTRPNSAELGRASSFLPRGL